MGVAVNLRDRIRHHLTTHGITPNEGLIAIALGSAEALREEGRVQMATAVLRVTNRASIERRSGNRFAGYSLESDIQEAVADWLDGDTIDAINDKLWCANEDCTNVREDHEIEEHGGYCAGCATTYRLNGTLGMDHG